MSKRENLAADSGPPVEERFYCEIGRFLGAFSQLEMSLRFTLSKALALPEGDEVEPLVSGLDFARLCMLLRINAQSRLAKGSKARQDAETILKKCLELNDQARVPIAHGTWVLTADGLAARVVSRNSGTLSYKFENPDQTAKKTSEIEDAHRTVIEDLLKLLSPGG